MGDSVVAGHQQSRLDRRSSGKTSSMTTGLIYIRQSRHREYERTVSPESQEQACRSLPAIRECNDVVVFRDLDLSGGKLANRPGLTNMIERIRLGDERREPIVVATYDQSRFSRSNIDSARIYAIFEERPWVDVVLVDGRFDRSPSGELSWTVLAAAAAHLRKSTGQKLSAAKRYAAGQGQMVGAVPAGYVWSGSGRDRELVIDEAVAAVVRRVFNEYASGRLSTRDIAYRLNSEGVRLPKFKGGWRADTVAQLLGNPAYISQSYVSRTRREEPVPGKWPAIIERRQWDQVQRLLNRYHRKGGRPDQATGLERSYAFQGLLRCAKCGRRMHCHPMKGRAYYHCRSNDAANPCRKLVREDALLPWAEGLLRVLDAYRPADLERSVAEQLAARQSRLNPSAIAQLEGSIERLGKRFEWGHITESEYRAEWERLVARRDELTASAGMAVDTATLPLGSLMAGWNSGDNRTRRDLLAVFFEELDVLDGQITAVVPRKDREAQVVALLEQSFGIARVAPAGLWATFTVRDCKRGLADCL
jgi:DNA invertase Pin-like site-specific DNA recombinase